MRAYSSPRVKVLLFNCASSFFLLPPASIPCLPPLPPSPASPPAAPPTDTATWGPSLRPRAFLTPLIRLGAPLDFRGGPLDLP